jgi:hypothetical protein
MNNTIVVLLLLLTFYPSLRAQDSQLMWLGEYISFSELPLLQPAFSKYSEQDLNNFRDKLGALRGARKQDEWEGRFAPGLFNEVGFSLLDISFDSGFAGLYVYTCRPELRWIDYGSVINRPDIIELVSEVPAGSPRRSEHKRFVKVKWGNRLYLVDEKSLPTWVEQAVGIYVTPENGGQEWTDFWESGNHEKELVGEPELPASFRHFTRKPITTTIRSVSTRRIAKEVSLGDTYYAADSAVYSVVIAAGRRQGVKKDMVFRLRNSDDEIVVTNVYPGSASGLIVRAINDETRVDHCLSDSLEPVPIQCPRIKAGHAVSTIVGKFSF